MKKAMLGLALIGAVAAHAGDLTLWYTQPAKPGMNEGLPIGNGKFGGMLLGGVEREVVQLNEITLWTGSEISTDDYGKMGSYQKLGDLVVELGGSAAPVSRPTALCASGHKAYFEHEEVSAASDGKVATKWCVEHHGKPVIWELRLPEPRVVTQYTLTSANDTPQRDPSTWELAGSNDGQQWVTLDKHTGEPPFARRGETKTFASNKSNSSYKTYRLIFQPNPGQRHFQVAEISLADITPGAGAGTAAANYRRALDLATAVHTVSYTAGGVNYKREAFASHPAGLMALRLSADKPGSCTGMIALPGAHEETTVAGGNTLTFSGALDNGLKYTAQLLALNEGGAIAVQDGKLQFSGCNRITLLLAAGTDYVADYARKYRGADPRAAVAERLKAAAAKAFDALKAEHIADYQALFNRVALDVGATPADRLALPIDQRKVLHAEKGGDPDLEEILFQYGRYLLISCSRLGGLPANLQGLWNDSNKPPWHSDYHANINIQMNYWPAEPANLSECHTPLFDLITSQLPAWRKATAAEKRFQTADGQPHGWAVRTSHGINGDQGWQWDVSANAWYCQHFWWHYVWTGDKAWLKRVAYPVLKETCEFWAARLKTLPDGRLVVPNGWSPEHGPHEDGVSYSQQIVWDLFNNYAAASAALGVDGDYRAQIVAMRDRLVGPQVGSWGQLLEWMIEKQDKLLDTPNDHHRHTSHLFAVYPGQQISVSQTPAFAAAAKKSLDARGTDAKSDVREWSFAWRCALYARLHDGELAHRMVQMFLADRNSCLNLFGLHPPMQMDGNFGITAGICEMLMQSQEANPETGNLKPEAKKSFFSFLDAGSKPPVYLIELLPALPACWAAGSVKGLRARGGFTVDIAWQAGKVTSYRIASAEPREVKVRVNGETKTMKSEKL
jgi:alpha-L-fucosidase 2